MNDGRTSALPKRLEASLERFADRRHLVGRPDRVEIQHLVSQIEKLPSAMIARLDGEIAYAAKLWHWQRVGIVGRLFQRLRLSDVELLYRWPEIARLFVFHRDGFLRERALNQMSEGMQSAFYVTVLAFRLNDWVPQVRAAAARCADRVLPSTNAEIIAQAALFLLGRRFAWGRWGDEAEALDRALSRVDVADALADVLLDARRGPMGAILKHASRWEAMDRHLYGLAANAFLPSVRAVALQELIEGVARWPVGWTRQWIDKIYGQFRLVRVYDERPVARSCTLESLVEQGARDRSGAVRKVAATALVNHRATLSNRDAVIDLLDEDRSAAIRERVDYVKRASGQGQESE